MKWLNLTCLLLIALVQQESPTSRQESGNVGIMNYWAPNPERKPISFRQRYLSSFHNLFRRYVGTVWDGERESGIGGPGVRPFEAVAIFSSLSVGHPSTAGGCSGLLWRHGGYLWGLTHGSVIAPLLDLGTNVILKDVLEVARKHNLGLSLPESFENLELCVQREGSPHFVARVVEAWSCQSLIAAFDHLQSAGWDFSEDESDDLLKSILSMFVVFRPIGEVRSGPSATAALASLLDQVHHGGLPRGCPVLAISSPFTGVATSENKTSEVRGRRCRSDRDINRDEIAHGGGEIQSPHQLRSPFMNSWSQGVLSGVSVAGSGSLLLTDARATGGSEGGPLFAKDSGQWKLAGMLLRSICHWRGEWVGFSLACYLESTLCGFLGVGTPSSTIGTKGGVVGNADGLHALSSISSCPIVLVKCGYSQGTGIPINGSLGLILTCAHVVRKHHLGLEVSWLNGKKLVTMNADVVYLTAPDFAYDVAVIKVGPGTDLPSIPISKELPERGDSVWLVGYAMYSGPRRCSSLEPPLLSRGIVSSVIAMPGKLPPLLQTTCCVQSGSSGGAVIREKDGTLLAMMVCNTAIEQFLPGSEKSQIIIHPSINFAIPAITLRDTLARFYEAEDPLVLNEFLSPDERIQQIWKLKVPEPGRSKL